MFGNYMRQYTGDLSQLFNQLFPQNSGQQQAPSMGTDMPAQQGGQPPMLSGMPLVTKEQPGMGDNQYNPLPQPIPAGMQGLQPPMMQQNQFPQMQQMDYPQMGQLQGSFRNPSQFDAPGFANLYSQPGVAQTSFQRGEELPLTGINYLRSLLRG